MATKPARGLVPNANLPAKVQSIPPNQTLYITNLPSNKIQKADLRTALYMLFSAYGHVLDVVALMTMKMRGQAHVTFRDVHAATQALRSLDGQEFLGRTMVSHIVIRCVWFYTNAVTISRKSNTPKASQNSSLSWMEPSISPTRRAPPMWSRPLCNRVSSTHHLLLQRALLARGKPRNPQALPISQ